MGTTDILGILFSFLIGQYMSENSEGVRMIK